MLRYAVVVEGIDSLQEFEGLKDNVRLWAAQAINKTADSGRTMAARRIRQQVNLPASYVSPAEKRLYVSKRAQRNDLEARITARRRATSLARFTTGTPQVNKAGVTVEISPGKARFLKRAFLIRLRRGSAALDTKFNLGLAVRLKPGETIRNKTQVRQLASGLYLLYGPSVDQIFRADSGAGVAAEISPELATDLEREFVRLVELNGF